ncbi:hypothetical protein ABPG77_009720 [Micractinium sp. CCAP 211/92]
MKFEISDESVLMLSGVGVATVAGFALLAPREHHNVFFAKDQPYNETMNRWFGQALACKATSDMCISACDANNVWPGFPCVHCFAFCGFHCFIVADTLKASLKLSGVQWFAASAALAHATATGKLNSIGYGAAAGQAAMGALCLWRGFCDD